MRNRHLYPDNWAEISRRCRELANYTCQHCGVVQGTVRISRRGNPYKVVVQAAHKDHSARARTDADLLCLCFTCHWWYDYLAWQRQQDLRLEHLRHCQLITPTRLQAVQCRHFQIEFALLRAGG